MTGNTKKKVLICDDEVNIRESIRYVVNKEGYDFTMVNDGMAAYEAACRENPDLIILDVGMPVMTGYEVCKKLRETSGFEKTTILILTAFGQATDREKAREAGTEHFMTKPFSPRELRLKIKELLLD